MKNYGKIISAVSALAILVAVSVPSAVYAETNDEMPSGYVTMCIEKFTLGQDYIVEPTLVPYYDGETGFDLTERLIGGQENLDNSQGYISAFADPSLFENDINIPDFIANAIEAANGQVEEKKSDGWLSGYDFYHTSGWMFVLNNSLASYSISNYTPANGDVIRWEFSVYGYGSDIGSDNSNWGGEPSLISQTNRDMLTSLIGEIDSDKDKNLSYTNIKSAYSSAVSIISDLQSTQTELDLAYSELLDAFKNPVLLETTLITETTAVNTDTTKAVTTVSTVKTSPKTGGSSSIAVFSIAGMLAAAVSLFSKKKRNN